MMMQTAATGAADNFTYVYDRYGNRWEQNVTGGSGPAPQLSFDPGTNRINSGVYTYDAAGNLVWDGVSNYTYDAEGNLTKVDGGATASYTYNALNQRVRIDFAGCRVPHSCAFFAHEWESTNPHAECPFIARQLVDCPTSPL